MQQVVKFLIWNLWKCCFWEMKFQNSWLGKSKSFHNSWLGISKSFHNSWLGFASSLVMKWFWYASSLVMKGFRYASSFVVKFHFSKTTFSEIVHFPTEIGFFPRFRSLWTAAVGRHREIFWFKTKISMHIKKS